MTFRAASAASWPRYQPQNAPELTFRANADAGIVFLIGAFPWSGLGSTTINTRDPMPAAFRPVAPLTIYDTGGANGLVVNTDGTLRWTGSTGNYSFRTFFFTTVTPG